MPSSLMYGLIIIPPTAIAISSLVFMFCCNLLNASWTATARSPLPSIVSVASASILLRSDLVSVCSMPAEYMPLVSDSQLACPLYIFSHSLMADCILDSFSLFRSNFDVASFVFNLSNIYAPLRFHTLSSAYLVASIEWLSLSG